MTGYILVDATKVSPSEFLDALGLPRTDLSLMHEQCIRAINRGDTYGWPPVLVDQCKKIIAEREPLTEVKDLGPGSIAA